MTNADDALHLALHLVVKNDEDQYSIWPAERPVPAGWQQVGMPGSREECLNFIEAAWTDMRPRSLREHMAAVSAKDHGTP